MNQQKTANVAAVIPVRARPQMLGDAIESVMKGNLLPRSLYVVIDSSGDDLISDRTAAEKSFQFWKSQFPHVNYHLLFGNEGGPARARNLAAGAAGEEWISFLDSDDLWLPEKLEKQMRYLEKRPHLMGASGFERWIKNGRVLGQPQKLKPGHGRFVKESIERCLVPCSSVIIKREIFLSLGGFDENFPVCEDYEFWIRYLLKYPMGLVGEEIAVKRSGDWDQLSTGHSLDKYRVLALLKLMESKDADKYRNEIKKACFEKYEIYAGGAVKRGTDEESSRLLDRIRSVFSPSSQELRQY